LYCLNAFRCNKRGTGWTRLFVRICVNTWQTRWLSLCIWRVVLLWWIVEILRELQGTMWQTKNIFLSGILLKKVTLIKQFSYNKVTSSFPAKIFYKQIYFCHITRLLISQIKSLKFGWNTPKSQSWVSQVHICTMIDHCYHSYQELWIESPLLRRDLHH
jgi:hypothetical protein